MMEQYPKHILQDILWNFSEEKFPVIEGFRLALKAYNERIKAEPFNVDFDQTVLNTGRVAVQYEYWDNEIEDSIEPDFLLTADNGEFFTVAELLFKIHNTVQEKLKEDDHHFFEGLDLWIGDHPNYPDTPLYFLQQGS